MSTCPPNSRKDPRRRQADRWTVTPPAISGLIPASGPVDELFDAGEVSGLSFSGDMAMGTQWEHLSVSNAEFTGCSLAGCHFADIQLTDILFRNCDLTNVNFSGGLYRVRFVDCRMTGAGFSETKMTQVSAEGCTARYAGFSFARMRNVLLRDCDLRESTFNDSRFEPAAFEKCNLSEAVFHRTPLRGIDLRDCRTEGLRAGTGDLQGAVVTSLQALELSRILGVEVRD